MVAGTRKRDKNRSVLGMSNLSNQKRGGVEHNSVSKSEDQPCSDEHADVLSSRLKRNSKQHDHRANDNAHLSALPVDKVGHNGQTDERTEGHGTIEETQHGATGNPKVVLPVAEGLEAVHHGAVKAICCVCQDEYDDIEVQQAQLGHLPPFHAFKGAAGKEEVSFWWFDRNNLLCRSRWAAETGYHVH